MPFSILVVIIIGGSHNGMSLIAIKFDMLSDNIYNGVWQTTNAIFH